MKKLLLIDVDCGVDDAVAIMIALASPNVEVLGITCCYGNSHLENTSRNALRVLHVCNKLEIPVFSGASASILGEPLLDEFYYGKDGLGDVPDPHAPGLDLLQKEHAALAILRIVNEQPGQVSLVATGPLTNLALAVKMDPTLPKKLKNVFIMGGNIEGRGNDTVCGEFNFASDPEAAYIVLNEYTCPVYIASWEFTCSTPLSWDISNTAVKTNELLSKIYEIQSNPENATLGAYHEVAFLDVAEEESTPTHVTALFYPTACARLFAGNTYNNSLYYMSGGAVRFYHEWIDQNTEKAKFMKKIYAHSMAKGEHKAGFVSCDSYAMAAAIDENFVTEVTSVGVTVELTGTLTRGMMVVDWTDKLKKENKVRLMKKCDIRKLETLFMAALK